MTLFPSRNQPVFPFLHLLKNLASPVFTLILNPYMRNSLLIPIIALILTGCAESNFLVTTTVNPSVKLTPQPRIAVLPMDLAGYGDGDLTVIRQNWRNTVEAGLLLNSFRVVDRDLVDNILQEQHFQKSGVVNKGSSVEVGKILGINYVLVGTVQVLASDGSKFHIELRVLDVESSELIATTFGTGDASIGYKASKELALKLKPLASAK